EQLWGRASGVGVGGNGAEWTGVGGRRRISWRSHRRARRFSRRLHHHLVRPEGMGQGAPARRLSTVYPRHAADHAARYLSHAAVILDGDATRLENAYLRSSRFARRVARIAHLQATYRPAI